MDPARWRQISDLYHAARAQPPPARDAFLSAACGGDESLHSEVQSLLAQQEGDSSRLDPPHPPSMVGRRIGTYVVQARIGAGGMGEVYRARDSRLGRDVAIKILPPAFTADADRLGRFEREARMLASLNHPGIATIYGFEESDGIRALVLELVDGETLAERLAHGPLTIHSALTLSRQIVDALEAAHEKGVVHRDLKPANVKITPGGAVKTPFMQKPR